MTPAWVCFLVLKNFFAKCLRTSSPPQTFPPLYSAFPVIELSEVVLYFLTPLNIGCSLFPSDFFFRLWPKLGHPLRLLPPLEFQSFFYYFVFPPSFLKRSIHIQASHPLPSSLRLFFCLFYGQASCGRGLKVCETNRHFPPYFFPFSPLFRLIQARPSR